MELYQLRSFVTIAEIGQLTKAAEKLHISQPALSAQIKALEDELDISLFERTPSGMQLTVAGRRLLLEAEKVLFAAYSLKNEAQFLKGEVVGEARLGTLSDPEFIRVGEWLGMAVDRYPLLEIELHQQVTGTAFAQVRDGGLDGSFYYGDLKHPNVIGLPLCKIVYRVAAPAAWEQQIKDLGWDGIAIQPWIIPPLISTHHQLVRNLFRDHGVDPISVIEADQEAVISSLVVSGIGMALMREDVALKKQAAGEVCLWKDVSVETTLNFIYLRDREHDPIIRALLDILRDTWGIREEFFNIGRHKNLSFVDTRY